MQQYSFIDLWLDQSHCHKITVFKSYSLLFYQWNVLCPRHFQIFVWHLVERFQIVCKWTTSFFCGGITIDTDPNNKMKLSNMLPKHKHKDQIIKHVSKTKTQRSNYQISQTQRLNYQTCDGECPKHSRANSFWKKNST